MQGVPAELLVARPHDRQWLAVAARHAAASTTSETATATGAPQHPPNRRGSTGSGGYRSGERAPGGGAQRLLDAAFTAMAQMEAALMAAAVRATALEAAALLRGEACQASRAGGTMLRASSDRALLHRPTVRRRSRRSCPATRRELPQRPPTPVRRAQGSGVTIARGGTAGCSTE